MCLLGLEACPIDKVITTGLADRLLDLLTRVSTQDHIWFETGLSYDNARLSQAMLCAGVICARPDYTKAGLESLHWLLNQQCAPGGYFRAIGTKGYLSKNPPWALFDQQPLEAQATIAACKMALSLTHDHKWLNGAQAAFNWFFGANDLGLSLIDAETGRCCDGLHPDRVNQNCGAESALAYLLSLSDMHYIARHLSASLRKDAYDHVLSPTKAISLTAA